MSTLKGLKACRTILTGAVQTGQHSFTKHGGYRQALRDFGSAKPNGVLKYRGQGGGIGHFGGIGDRLLIIESRGGDKGQPTLEIIENLGYPEQKTTLITYLD